MTVNQGKAWGLMYTGMRYLVRTAWWKATRAVDVRERKSVLPQEMAWCAKNWQALMATDDL